jgi:protein subunit release factor B
MTAMASESAHRAADNRGGASAAATFAANSHNATSAAIDSTLLANQISTLCRTLERSFCKLVHPCQTVAGHVVELANKDKEKEKSKNIQTKYKSKLIYESEKQQS